MRSKVTPKSYAAIVFPSMVLNLAPDKNPFIQNFASISAKRLMFSDYLHSPTMVQAYKVSSSESTGSFRLLVKLARSSPRFKGYSVCSLRELLSHS